MEAEELSERQAKVRAARDWLEAKTAHVNAAAALMDARLKLEQCEVVLDERRQALGALLKPEQRELAIDPQCWNGRRLTRVIVIVRGQSPSSVSVTMVDAEMASV